MQLPKIIQRIHRFINPPRHSELRQLEQYRRDMHVKAEEYERRKAELERPNYTRHGQVYGLIAMAAVVVIAGFFLVLARM